MNARDAIRFSIDMSDHVVDSYVKDLTDADLLVRPIPGMNHLAWQLGHLIGATRHFGEMIAPGTMPPLPEGFAEGHGREAFVVDDPAKFYSVARYTELWKQQGEALRRLLDGLSDADLDRTDPKFPPFAPTVGALLNMCGLHPMMHAGQFVAVRRKLGKPVAI
jgi:hypothetical protein